MMLSLSNAIFQNNQDKAISFSSRAKFAFLTTPSTQVHYLIVSLENINRNDTMPDARTKGGAIYNFCDRLSVNKTE